MSENKIQAAEVAINALKDYQQLMRILPKLKTEQATELTTQAVATVSAMAKDYTGRI